MTFIKWRGPRVRWFIGTDWSKPWVGLDLATGTRLLIVQPLPFLGVWIQWVQPDGTFSGG